MFEFERLELDGREYPELLFEEFPLVLDEREYPPSLFVSPRRATSPFRLVIPLRLELDLCVPFVRDA